MQDSSTSERIQQLSKQAELDPNRLWVYDPEYRCNVPLVSGDLPSAWELWGPVALLAVFLLVMFFL